MTQDRILDALDWCDEEERREGLGDAVSSHGPRCDRFAAQPPAASSCKHRIDYRDTLAALFAILISFGAVALFGGA